MGRPFGQWLGRYSHLPKVPKPDKPPEKSPLVSTTTALYASSYYIVWVRENGHAALFGTAKGHGLNFDVLDRDEMKGDESKRPDDEFVNGLLKEEGICRQ